MHIFQLLNPLRRTLQRLLGVSTFGVKALIVDASHRVLLVEHTYIDGWHLPGGGIRAGESPKAALIREVAEETGLQVLSEPILFGVYSHKIYGASDYPVLYVVKHFNIQPKVPCCEIKQIAWFERHNLPINTTESTKKRLNEYFEGLPPSDIW